ncbi:MAG: hypothetical protein GF350_07015 [Chitinivibrionales bacterium]|nr:hypothetical protein [Chitinivibrionales bacterium]
MSFRDMFRFGLVILVVITGVFLSGCSRLAVLETPQGKLVVEDLNYTHKSGNLYVYDPHRLILVLARADNENFSVSDLNYIVQSGAYLLDSDFHKFHIHETYRGAKFMEASTDTFRLEFEANDDSSWGDFTLHWPGNDPVEIGISD